MEEKKEKHTYILCGRLVDVYSKYTEANIFEDIRIRNTNLHITIKHTIKDTFYEKSSNRGRAAMILIDKLNNRSVK